MEDIENLKKLLQEEILAKREEYGFSLSPNAKINDVNHYKIMEFYSINPSWDNFAVDLQSKDITNDFFEKELIKILDRIIRIYQSEKVLTLSTFDCDILDEVAEKINTINLKYYVPVTGKLHRKILKLNTECEYFQINKNKFSISRLPPNILYIGDPSRINLKITPPIIDSQDNKIRIKSIFGIVPPLIIHSIQKKFFYKIEISEI